MGRWKRRSTARSKKIKLNINDSDESENDDNTDSDKNDVGNKKPRQQPPSLTNTRSASQASSHSSSLSSQSSLKDHSSPVSHSNIDKGQQQQLSSGLNDGNDSLPTEVSISSTTPPTTKVTHAEISTASRDPPKITPSSTESSLHSHPPPSKNTDVTTMTTTNKATTSTTPQLLPPQTRPKTITNRISSDMFPSKVDPRQSTLFSTARNSMLRSYTGGVSQTVLHYEVINEELMSVEDYLVDYATRKKEFNKKGDNKSSAASTSDDVNDIVIGNHSFPALTLTVLSQPYLSLPPTLESHERRVLHELCFSIGLYHATSHTTPPCLIVAIDSKGLCAAQAVVPPPVMPYMKEYRPWYYQKSAEDDNDKKKNDYDGDEDDDLTDTQGNLSSCIKSFTPSEVVREEMNAHRTAINALLMNPNRCIRPSDVIDFDEDLAFQKCLVKMVKSPQELENMMNEIAKEKDVGFGVWNYTESKYYEMTNLVVLSTATTCYIIDVTSQGVWGVVRYHLSRLFSNNDIVKVSYGGGGIVGDYQDGIASLCRDFGLGVINHFDIQEAALSMMMEVVASSDGIDYELLLRYYGLSEEDCVRYKHLREVYGRKMKKGGRDGEQMNDPRRRPLRDDMISFMTYEVGYLVTLRRLMMRDMTRYDFIGYDGETSPRNSDSENNVLMEVMERKSLGMYAPMSSSEDDVDGFWTPPDSDDEEGKEKEKQQRVFDAFHLGRHKEFTKVLNSSQKVCLNFWQHKKEIPTHNSTWRSILSIHKAAASSSKNQQHTKFNQKQKQIIFIKLFQWRQQLASSLEVVPGSICSTEFLATVALKGPKSVEDVRRVAVFLPSMLLEEEDGYVEQIVNICNAAMEEEGSSSEDEEEEDERGYVSDGSSMSGGEKVKGEVDVGHEAMMNVAMNSTISTDDGSEFEDCVDGDDNIIDMDIDNDNNTSVMRQHNYINDMYDKLLTHEELLTNNKSRSNETNSKPDEETMMIPPPPMINCDDKTPKIGTKKKVSLPPQQQSKENNKSKINQNQISPNTALMQRLVPTSLDVHDDYNHVISNDNIVPVIETKIKHHLVPNFLKTAFKKICCAVCVTDRNKY